MALQELQGKTLGQKKKHYNEIVKKAIDGDLKIQAADCNPANNDLNNLMKIDVAGKESNVEYILNILQGDDMLYVSRAIKQSKWLFTDRQYSHIINPHHLYTQLFPNMTFIACTKLLLHIRIHLKDADRVEDFYNFIKEKDIHCALSWLPNCSLPFVEIEVRKHHKNINSHLFKRLCEKSITILEIMIESCSYVPVKQDKLAAAMFLLKSQTRKFLDIVESVHTDGVPHFGPKSTKILMKNCPQRILDKLEIYIEKIHLHTFAKHFKPAEIKDFIFKISEKKDMQSWLIYDNLKHFIRYLPNEDRFDFIKTFLIEKSNKELDKDVGILLHSSANIYQWYRFAPFKVALADLTKLIRTESSPYERNAMFCVLLSSANRNPQDVQTILQYYNDRHINERFKFKMQFINMLLTQTDTYRFNETAWNTLNNLFYSIEVYNIVSENNVQTCIEAIILYKLLHNEKIPEIIENQFKFQTMESIKKKLTDEEGNKVFDFLYTTIESKIKNKNINSEIELTETVNLLENVQTLLADWNKNLVDYPWFLDKVKQLIKLKSDNSWKSNLSTLYTRNKSWRRIMFEESLMLSPSEETCYNVLQHDPELMMHNKSTVEQLRRDDNVSLRRVLRSLRVYWPQTLAANWMAWYLSNLDQPGTPKAVIRGLCTLATQQQLNDILKKHAPIESKINWSEDDQVVLNLRKQLARNMYVSRPLLSLELVLLYAKGDYLQFVLPTINAVFYNMSATHTQEHASKLLDTPVSLQKHVIRFSSTKFKSEELKRLFHDIWKKTRSPTIRAVLFKVTYKLLCRQVNPTMMQEIWEQLSYFIDCLSLEENKIIYDTLTNVDRVPMPVRGKFLMKSYKFLKSLPPKANYAGAVNSLEYKMVDLIMHLDSEFVASVLESLDSQSYMFTQLLASYLLCATDVESQSERYKKFVLPVMESSFALWDVKLNDSFRARDNVIALLQTTLSTYFERFVDMKKKIVFPTKLFADIQDQLQKRLPVERNYLTLTTWKLITTFVKILEEQKDMLVDTEHELYLKALPKFSEICLEYLREDIKKHFSSIYWLFADSLNQAFNFINQEVYIELLRSLLKDEEFVPSYLVVLNNIPLYDLDDETKKKVFTLREKIFSNPSVEVKWHYYNKTGQERVTHPHW